MNERTREWRRWRRGVWIVRRARFGVAREGRQGRWFRRYMRLLALVETYQLMSYPWVYFMGENARYRRKDEFRYPVRNPTENWDDSHYNRCHQRYLRNRELRPCHDRCKKPG